MNQIIAALLLFGLASAAIIPIIASSWEQITANSVSVAEFMKMQQTQNGQILNLISIEQESGVISADLMNVGIYDVTVDVVLMDGAMAPYTLTDKNLNSITTIPLNEIVLLDVTGTGSTVQIISESGKLFEYTV